MEGHPVPIQGPDLLDLLEDGSMGRANGLEGFEGIPDIFGDKLPAVVKPHSPSQMKDVRSLVGLLPSLCQVRNDPEVFIRADETVEEQPNYMKGKGIGGNAGIESDGIGLDGDSHHLGRPALPFATAPDAEDQDGDAEEEQPAPHGPSRAREVAIRERASWRWVSAAA